MSLGIRGGKDEHALSVSAVNRTTAESILSYRNEAGGSINTFWENIFTLKNLLISKP
jgi:hypothetical protein